MKKAKKGKKTHVYLTPQESKVLRKFEEFLDELWKLDVMNKLCPR